MQYEGSCHCGGIVFTVEGRIDQVVDCNCSMCRRRGGLLWFGMRRRRGAGAATAAAKESLDDLARRADRIVTIKGGLVVPHEL